MTGPRLKRNTRNKKFKLAVDKNSSFVQWPRLLRTLVFRGYDLSMKNIRTNHTKAFIYWHQGWTQAPKVAQYCLKSWLDSAFNVIQIDSENFKNYIGQSHLTNMLNKIANRVGKDVSYQHFADLLRLTLLAENKYSLWVDSTVYLNDPNKLT